MMEMTFGLGNEMAKSGGAGPAEDDCRGNDAASRKE